ncbi:MAG: tRNA (N6-isopentenyl adenosine(37)-C2)-methylthiotransferase MiaB [Christensenella sp.]|jgi:tRNA-2-methylthio-N6-dimethylallyladenosine synthase|nr:tRNA (N6-isopentenyl adenosine(37)-C2)-methylthiotransferase MiaB [Christensenella sp.]
MRKTVEVPPEELQKSLQASASLKKELEGRGFQYYIESYGCQMNDHDAEKLSGMLQTCGFSPAPSKEEATLLLFNTCCVREHAEKRVFGNIGALKKRKEDEPGLLIGVCGCMMQQREVAERLFKRFPFVDLVFGTHELHHFPLLLSRTLAGERVFSVRESDGEIVEGLPVVRGGSFSTFVTIMYGCNNFCSYCIVPYVRGRERSRAPGNIVAEVRSLAERGFREITLLGQNVNSYAYADDGVDFPELLRRVSTVEGIERIRFMTSHPKDLSPRLIEAMATLPKVCHHIHLPVQSGSNRILSEMNRRYTREKYLGLVEDIRAAVDGVELTTDIIVGFPGETEEDFEETLALVRQVGFSAAYTFMYSPRLGTRAAEMENQVPEEVKKDRLLRLNACSAEQLKVGNQKYIGQEGTVLVEGCDRREKAPMAYGKLTNFKMVYFPGDAGLIGSMHHVRITGIQNNSLIGELVE